MTRDRALGIFVHGHEYSRRHWGWVEIKREVTLNGVKMVCKQMVFDTRWLNSGPSRWHLNTSPVYISFGLWEQAEARHRESTPVMKTLSQEEKAQIKAIMWSRYWAHREVRKRWFARTYGRGAMEEFDNNK